MDRLKILRKHIGNPATHKGLEIGPLNRPIVKKSEGNISYVDYTTKEHLIEIHKVDPNIPLDKICEPDFIWGKQGSLKEIMSEAIPFNYVIASHVVEHVPNMIGWFKELEVVLCDDGVITLAVPDKRFTFDYQRPLTSLGDLLEAYWENTKRPSLRHVWDAVTMTIKVNPIQAWQGLEDIGSLEHYNTFADGLRATLSTHNDSQYYHDCHCWVITPDHLLDLWSGVAKLGLFGFYVLDLTPTQYGQDEFFVTLKRVPPDFSADKKLEIQLASFDKWRVRGEGPPLARRRRIRPLPLFSTPT